MTADERAALAADLAHPVGRPALLHAPALPDDDSTDGAVEEVPDWMRAAIP